MTDTQIFAFVVMPFLFILTCSMVFVSREKQKPEEPASPPGPVTGPRVYTRKPRKRQTSIGPADSAEN
jgi:hypothetical protein